MGLASVYITFQNIQQLFYIDPYYDYFYHQQGKAFSY